MYMLGYTQFFTLFFHFWLHHTMYSHGGCLSTCSNMIKKSWTVPNLGVIVFAHTRIYRDIRLWEMRFSYIPRYTPNISRYTIVGYLSRGSGFQMRADRAWSKGVCCSCLVYVCTCTIWNPDKVYSRYIPCIYHVYSKRRCIPGISQVYTMDIKIYYHAFMGNSML